MRERDASDGVHELTPGPDQPEDHANVVPGGGAEEKAEQVWVCHQPVQQHRRTRPGRRSRLVEDGPGAADAPTPESERWESACMEGGVGVMRIACGACGRMYVCENTAGPTPPSNVNGEIDIHNALQRTSDN